MKLQSIYRHLAALAVLTIPVLGYAAPSAYAEDRTGPDSFPGVTNAGGVQTDSGAVFLMMVKVLFFLILIIGFFLLIIKFLSKKKLSWMQGRAVKSLGGVPLGPNKSVQIVEIGRSIYVIGVGDNVNLIQRIDDPEEVAIITASLTSDSTGSGQGMQKLGELIGGWTKRKQEPVREDEMTASFQDVFQAKMKNMSGRKKMIEDLLSQNDKPDGKADS